MTYSHKILAYLQQVPEASGPQIGEAVGKPSYWLSRQLSKLKIKGFIREVRREGQQIVWALGDRPVSEYCAKPGRKHEPKVERKPTVVVPVAGNDISEHVAAWVAAGNSVEILPGFQERPPVVMPVRAHVRDF